MKRKHFIFATLAFLSAPTFAQYASAYKTEETDYGRLDALVGKEYWIKFNPKGMRQRFVTSIKTMQSRMDEFVITKDTKFVVTGWEKSEIKLDYLKIQFEDGKEAYLGLGIIWDSRKEILPDVFDGTEFNDYTEYIYKDVPAVVLANFKAKKAKQKAQAEAEYKAKGGVRIGMSKEEVLKSNWGKPESVNKSTSASGTREQWVYGGRNYLYFTNGVLTGIQN